MRREVAVVTIVHGRHGHLARQLRSLSAGAPQASHVVVAMADPELLSVDLGERVRVVAIDADPGSLPLAAARNRGADKALERGADTIVFLDVDCIPGPSLVSAYDSAVARWPGCIWSGPVTYLPPDLTEAQLSRPYLLDAPHPARPAPDPGELVHAADPDLFWSLSFALSRDAWNRSGGFCERYVGYGGEDTDFARQAVARGLRLGWVGDARAYHQYHDTQDPPVQHLEDILRNGAVFCERWGEWPMTGWLEDFRRLGLVEHVDGTWRATTKG